MCSPVQSAGQFGFVGRREVWWWWLCEVPGQAQDDWHPRVWIHVLYSTGSKYLGAFWLQIWLFGYLGDKEGRGKSESGALN